MSHAAAYRNLAHLQESASTARMLNLLGVARRHGADPEYLAAPLFVSPTLNRTMLVKHRLRANETELFTGGRANVTKLIVPLDGADLRLGGRSVFIGQGNYDLVMRALVDTHWDTCDADRELLSLLDQAPSFDPFLLREHLRRHGYGPARCYFDISDADIARMRVSVAADLAPLADLCFGAGASPAQVARLADQIMAGQTDGAGESLRQVLKLEPAAYAEALFCWKGFLYYRWRLAEALPKIPLVAEGFRAARPNDMLDRDSQGEAAKAGAALAEKLVRACRASQRSLADYDAAFAQLIAGSPKPFRDFLLDAPARFTALGQAFSAIDHAMSFWRFRFPPGRRPSAPAKELAAIFEDFEDAFAYSRGAETPARDAA